MSWPRTGSGLTGGASAGIIGTGVTTIRWGSKETVTSIAGTANNGTSVGIVTRIHQRSLVDNAKLPNGDGPTITRVQVIDGQMWDVTIRDDSGLGIPAIGAVVVIVDLGGHINGYSTGVGLKYSATVVENGYDTAPKQAGERSFSVENLLLIESQTGT